MDSSTLRDKLINTYKLYVEASHKDEIEVTDKILSDFNILYIDYFNKTIEEETVFSGSPKFLYKPYLFEEIEKLEEDALDFSELEHFKKIYKSNYKIINPSLYEKSFPIEPSKKITTFFYYNLLDKENKELFTNTIKKRIEFLGLELFKRGVTVKIVD